MSGTEPPLFYSLYLYGVDRAKFTFYNFVLGLFKESVATRGVNMAVNTRTVR